jgi:hypothetical protein
MSFGYKVGFVVENRVVGTIFILENVYVYTHLTVGRRKQTNCSLTAHRHCFKLSASGGTVQKSFTFHRLVMLCLPDYLVFIRKWNLQHSLECGEIFDAPTFALFFTVPRERSAECHFRSKHNNNHIDSYAKINGGYFCIAVLESKN